MSSAADDEENDQKPMESDKDLEPKPESDTGDAKSCQTKPREKKPLNPLSLFKEDFGHFKQDFMNIFKDKEMKNSEPKEKRPLNLKEDLNQFRDELSNFRDDISAILRKGLWKDDFKIKAQDQNGDRQNGEPEKSCQKVKAQNGSLVENLEIVERELEENVSGKNEELFEEKLDLKEKDDGEDASEEMRTEEMVQPINTDEQSCERDTMVEEDEGNGEDKLSEEDEVIVLHKQPLISLSSGISLLRLKDIQKQQRGPLTGDVWAVKNFAQYLTLDPNTANSELVLSEGNRKASRVWCSVLDPDHVIDHPERFELCPQVLCREGLLDSVYWEVEWTGGADVGVSYNSIVRRGEPSVCLLGHNPASWSLECSEGSYTPCHQQRRYKSVCPEPFSHRVGVFLDFEAGSLSFYCVSAEAMVHLHTFSSTFTEPLYPGFWVWAYDGSVSLSHVELDWERLLQ